MKKFYIIPIIGIIIILTIFLLGGFKSDENKNKIKVAEVTHSIFYTPFYVAIENGYFKDEGIDIELLLVSGSDNVAASVLSKDAFIGLAGPESAVFVYNSNNKDYLQVFSGLTKKDGQFIISRNKDFKWDDLKNKEILVGRSTGMPALSFFEAIKNEGINKSEVNINTSIEFSELAGAFIGGTGDYVNLFEPLASSLEKENIGYVVDSVGAHSKEFPYTAFYAKKSFIEENKDLIKRFDKAINKGIKYTMENNSTKIANTIKDQFKDTDVDVLAKMIERYKDADVWVSNTHISKEFFNTLITLLKDNNLIKKNIVYNDMVVNLND